jgi:hypothetical protein
LKTEFGSKIKATTIDSILDKSLKVETNIPKEDVLLILKSKYQIDLENDNIVFKQNGEVVKNDKTLNPKTIEEVFSEFLTPYLKTPSGGTGGKNEQGKPKPNSMQAFKSEMESKGIKLGSAEYNREMSERIKNKTLSL